ncbi:MAG TPA: response regulator [Paraburkholderia sp.]|jgi:CheY-like chemotaxis protein|nr:response regulator [Paraburkholderia sp.]
MTALNHAGARAQPRVRYGRIAAAAYAAVSRQPAALALLCAFALLGAPALGAALAAMCAWLRVSAAQAHTLERLRRCEDEAARLRAENRRQQLRGDAEFALARRQGAADIARETTRCALQARRLVGEPLRAVAELLDATAPPVSVHASAEPSLRGVPLALLHAALGTLAQTAADALDPVPVAARRIVLDETPVDVRDVIDGAVVLLAPRASAQGLRLRVRVDRSVAAQVLADRMRVGQIVFDLLDYAIASTKTGQVTLTARAQALNAASQRISIGVSGTRDKADAAAGSTAHSTDDAPAESPAVDAEADLALCRLLAQRMGGALTVGDTGVFGVCAAFTAPFTIETLAHRPARREPRQAVVELDDRDERQALVDLLDKLGVSVAPSGSPAPPRVHLRFTDRPAAPQAGAARVVAVRDAFIAGGLRVVRDRVELSINPLSWSAVQRACGMDEACDAYEAGSGEGNGAGNGNGEGADMRWPQLTMAADTARRNPGTAPREQRRTVLIVDDNEINRRVLQRQLEVLGHMAMAAANADVALAALGQQCFDLVITDLHMPGLSGVELAQRMRASLPPTPIVLMSGQSGIGEPGAIPRELFAALLPKPASLDALRACIDALFAARVIDDGAAQDEAAHAESMDRSHLDALSARGIDIEDMLRGWQRTMHEDLALLRERSQSGDAAGVRATLHRLSGAVGLIGARELMAALRNASAMQPVADARLVDDLTARMRALIAQLDATAAPAV